MQSTDMVNTVKKAVEHLKWRLENFNGKTLNVRENDIKAYNMIFDFVEQKHKEQINDHQLFAKMYITFYGELLKYYGTTVMDTQPEKDIQQILKMPMEQVIEKFIDKAYDMEMLIQLPKSERFEPVKYKNPRDLEWDFKFVDKMEYQDAEDSLTAMINNAINSFN